MINDQSHHQIGIKTGSVALVGAGPGDPELITIKAIRLLEQADVILYDRLCNPDFLQYARPDASILSVGKKPGKPSIPQSDINHRMIEEARKGKLVVRLKGGDPFVFGRGGEECLELNRYGIPFEIVPGVSSITAVPAYAGIPLTMRNLATGFTIISGHLHSGSESYNWKALASISTLVVLMGLKNISEIFRLLIENGKDPDTPAAIIHWGTTCEQQVAIGSVSDLPEKATKFSSPVTIIIGDVVKFHDSLKWFDPESIKLPVMEPISDKEIV